MQENIFIFKILPKMSFHIQTLDINMSGISYVIKITDYIIIFRINNICDIYNNHYRHVIKLDLTNLQGNVVNGEAINDQMILLYTDKKKLYKFNIETQSVSYIQELHIFVNKNMFCTKTEVLSNKEGKFTIVKRFKNELVVFKEVLDGFVAVFKTHVIFFTKEFKVTKEFDLKDFQVENITHFDIFELNKGIIILLNQKTIYFLRKFVILDSRKFSESDSLVRHGIIFNEMFLAGENNIFKLFSIENDKFIQKAKTTLHSKNIRGFICFNDKIHSYGEDGLMLQIDINKKMNFYVRRLYEHFSVNFYKNSWVVANDRAVDFYTLEKNKQSIIKDKNVSSDLLECINKNRLSQENCANAKFNLKFKTNKIVLEADLFGRFFAYVTQAGLFLYTYEREEIEQIRKFTNGIKMKFVGKYLIVLEKNKQIVLFDCEERKVLDGINIKLHKNFSSIFKETESTFVVENNKYKIDNDKCIMIEKIENEIIDLRNKSILLETEENKLYKGIINNECNYMDTRIILNNKEIVIGTYILNATKNDEDFIFVLANGHSLKTKRNF